MEKGCKILTCLNLSVQCAQSKFMLTNRNTDILQTNLVSKLSKYLSLQTWSNINVYNAYISLL